MNSKSFQFEPHLSSIGGVNANVMALLAYLLGIILSFIPGINVIAWLAPLVIFFIEKDSPLVKFHAMQSFLLNIASFVLFSIIALVIGGSAIGAIVGGANNSSAAAGSFVGLSILTMILGAVVFLACVIFCIIGCVNAYKNRTYLFPVIGNWAAKLSGLNV